MNYRVWCSAPLFPQLYQWRSCRKLCVIRSGWDKRGHLNHRPTSDVRRIAVDRRTWLPHFPRRIPDPSYNNAPGRDLEQYNYNTTIMIYVDTIQAVKLITETIKPAYDF